MTVLELKNISKSFKQAHDQLSVLKKINISINAHEIVALVGASGSGKSTLLHIAAMLLPYESGELFIQNTDVKNLSQKEKTNLRLNNIGFIYQTSNLLSDFTAVENVAFPLILQGNDRRDSIQKSEKLLSELGLENRATAFPSKLSGGEAQRVAIARSMIHNPSIILADEPTGNLDSDNANKIIEMLINQAKQKNASVLIVTHDQNIARKCDRILNLNNGIIND